MINEINASLLLFKYQVIIYTDLNEIKRILRQKIFSTKDINFI